MEKKIIIYIIVLCLGALGIGNLFIHPELPSFRHNDIDSFFDEVNELD